MGDMLNECLVLGARDWSGNIGEWVVNELAAVTGFWRGEGEDCKTRKGYDVPPLRHYGRFDGMVVTLGRALIEPFDQLLDGELEDVIRANLTLPLLATQRYVQARGERGGTVVLVGSYAHDHVLSNSVPYCAAKAGLNHAVRCLAWDYGDRFRFYIVNPHHVEGTPMERYVLDAIKRGKGFTEEDARAYQAKDLRTDANLTAPEVARVIAKLLDDPSDEWLWANGSSINLYGGIR